MATSAFSGLLTNATSAQTTEDSEDIPLESIPLYRITNALWYVCCPVIILLGTFGNVITIVIMTRMTSAESSFNIYFTGIAIVDLLVLYSFSFIEWINITFKYRLYDIHVVFCKIAIWICTGSGTVGCWFLVCMTSHRAVSVVWPHRVNSLCTRRTVLFLVIGIATAIAALYSHYLFGFNLVSYDGGASYQCLMESQEYIHFVVNVFTYIELTIYSLLPFVCLLLGNSILIWKLSSSVKKARNKLNQGNSKQVLLREKAANSVTLTVVVVTLTFIVLTLPVSINYIISYFAREYNEVTGYEYAKAHLFYTITYLLANCNSAVNFYLYCLTGRRFREEFIKLMSCWKIRQGSDSSTRTEVSLHSSNTKHHYPAE